MIFSVIAQMQKKAIPITQSCRVLGVSRAGFYEAKHRLEQPKICKTSIHLRAAFAANQQCYGSRRMVTALRAQGIKIGRHRVRTLMRREKLIPVWKRKFVHTTNSNHGLPIAPNILARNFDPEAPNVAYVSDITYIRTRTGWLYLATVLDLFSRKVVGWAMAPNMPAGLVCQALQMAISQRRPPAGLIVHSDRGSQYASEQYQALLAKHGFVCSMSGRGNCWDNAVAERFFLNLKMERVWQRDYANQEEAKKDIADYIVSFYNASRINSVLGNMSPVAYEQKMAALAKKPIEVSEIS
jgi:putative transposase